MSASEIAKKHLDEALREAKERGYDSDAIARYMLSHVIAKFLEYRSVKDVKSELEYLAENCDPEGDHEFMRP